MGTNECLLDIPHWDFHWQRNYQLKRAKILRPGDKLSISCTWDNSPENQQVINGIQQQSRDVKWGESTKRRDVPGRRLRHRIISPRW